MTNIVFFGTEDFSLVALKALVEAKFPIVAVVTKPDSPKGRGHVVTKPAVKIFAEEHSITVWQPEKLNNINNEIAKLDNPAGVLVSYGKIIPQATLNLFNPGIINLHPSLLPKYRGPSPIETAIVMGDQEAGVSIMKLEAKMDAGPVYAQKTFALNGTETADQLYDHVGELGSKLLVETLPAILDGSITPYEQDNNIATYCHIIKKTDGFIDWNEEAEIIEARIRAYHIWPKSRTTLGNIDVIITEAKVLADSNYGDPGHLTIRDNELIVDAGFGSLSITSLKPLGKKEMPVSAFLAGYRSQLAN